MFFPLRIAKVPISEGTITIIIIFDNDNDKDDDHRINTKILGNCTWDNIEYHSIMYKHHPIIISSIAILTIIIIIILTTPATTKEQHATYSSHFGNSNIGNHHPTQYYENDCSTNDDVEHDEHQDEDIITHHENPYDTKQKPSCCSLSCLDHYRTYHPQ